MSGVSAHDVAAELRRRMPGVGVKKLHKLLYYCQGHHLATFGKPLFDETISAWDMGPVVGTLWRQEKEGEAPLVGAELTEAGLNTVGYVLHRYGALSGAELERLTHSEAPWQQANRGRRPKTSARIPLESIEAYFRAEEEADEDDDSSLLPDSEALTSWLLQVKGPPVRPPAYDSLDDIQARAHRG